MNVGNIKYTIPNRSYKFEQRFFKYTIRHRVTCFQTELIAYLIRIGKKELAKYSDLQKICLMLLPFRVR